VIVRNFVVGDGFCGKTSLLLRFLNDKFIDNYIPTVCEASVTQINVDGQVISLSLWDTAGQEDYDLLRPLCYNKAHVILMCFSVDSRTSFDNILLKWLPEQLHYCADIPRVLVATKTDLRTQVDGVTYQEASSLSDDINALAYCECSAKTGEGIHGVFQTSARAALLRRTTDIKRHNCSIV